MNNAILVSLVLSISVWGCGEGYHKPPDLTTLNKASLAAPIYIGQTPDGQSVMQVQITARTCDSWDGCPQIHYVYYVGAATTVNTNHTEGKFSHQDVWVTINGKRLPVDYVEAQIEAAKAKEKK